MRNGYKTEKPRRDYNRAWLRDILGNKCIRCGSTKNLHFDHIDPSTKSFNISQALGYSWDRLVDEVKKCQLLCRKCHVAKTLVDNGLSPAKHGTDSRYTNKKCRCRACKEAHSRYCLEWKERTQMAAKL